MNFFPHSFIWCEAKATLPTSHNSNCCFVRKRFRQEWSCWIVAIVTHGHGFHKNGCTFLRGKFDRSGRYIERNTLATLFLLFLKQSFFVVTCNSLLRLDAKPELCEPKLLQIKSPWMIERSHIESPSRTRFAGSGKSRPQIVLCQVTRINKVLA